MPQAKRARGRPRKKESEYLYGLGIAKMLEVKTTRAARRWEKMLQRIERYGLPANLKIDEHMRVALKEMKKAAANLARVSADWKPIVGVVGVQLFEKGDHVTIRDDKQEKYRYLDDPSAELEVVQIDGSTIICSGSSAKLPITVPFPRAHVQLVQEADA